MGISGLLPLLKSIHRPTELKKFDGETFGVDAYGWLHRGAISCAIELAQGKPTRKYVDFAMNRVRMLKHFGVTPYLVFDGDFLPSKAATEASRSKRREEGRKLGLELLKAGKPSQAHQELQKAIDVTPEMARHLIEALKQANIPYVVAPYEADAQLVYLERQGITSGIISEDSDLLVFGAKRLITKLDQYGQCVEVNRRDFNACREVSFVGWDDRLFRQMAILSGCDYLDSIPGLGLKTAHRLLRKHKTVERILRTLQFEVGILPSISGTCEPVNSPARRRLDKLPFIGAAVEPQLAQRIASGDVNPITKQEIIISAPPSPRKRTASGAHRPGTVSSQSPRETTKKPIDTYFKQHRRIALAEMDPNCFHVNPERVTREGTQPIVFPLPRPYIDGAEATAANPPRTYIDRSGRSPRVLRRRTEPISNLLTGDGRSLMSDSRRNSAGPGARTSQLPDTASVGTNPRPPKKARLCDDTALRTDTEVEKSKFFSPSGSRAPKIMKGQGYLMSDDSVEEALKELPDLDGWSKGPGRRKTIAVFQGQSDTPEVKSKAEPTVVSDVEQEQLETVPDTPPKSNLNRFNYTPGGVTCASQPSRLSRRQSSISSTRSSLLSLTPLSTFSSQQSTAATPATTPRLTPLQQLERRAIGKGKESPTSKFAATRAPKRSSLGRMSLDSIPVNPAFVPLPPVDFAEVEALNNAVGSEDLLIPESETEESEAAPGTENRDPRGKRTACRTLDLSQYMFTSS
ncbi:hypothetical protein NPX13_g7922 [Xylaria arbuscula]|uniref:Exonuclease 1 n=1 Tax=Xylaria arbuscula TaxID=114810 RepID=A0A9W8TJ26_9PEZI|nr:hypothetical protein NPX13_g7922 [Xylaria arbuscula]